MDNKNKIRESSSAYLKYTGLAFQMLAVIMIFVFGGIKLDEYLHTSFPFFTLGLSIAGVILGTYVGVKDFVKKKDKK